MASPNAVFAAFDLQERKITNLVSLNLSIRSALYCHLSDIGERALHSFLSLPGSEFWNPPSFQLLYVSRAFDIGLPFALIENMPSAEAHRRMIGKSIKCNKELPLTLISEVHAAAILTELGAEVIFIKRQSTPTPDIRANLDNGPAVDVEVTRADTRWIHKAVNHGLEIISDALRVNDLDWNLACFFTDASNQEDLDLALNAAIELTPNESREVPNRWSVSAIPIELGEILTGGKADFFAPKWWPKDEPNRNVMGSVIGTNVARTILFKSLLPIVAYTGPLISKAESGQGDISRPYLIALDVSELPRAHERILPDLQEYFSSRAHISGVLLFESRFYCGVEKKEWIISIHENPNAHHPLPDQLLKIANGEKIVMDFKLSAK